MKVVAMSILTAFLVLAFPCNVLAESSFSTGNDFLNTCSKGAHRESCASYIAGLIAGIQGTEWEWLQFRTTPEEFTKGLHEKDGDDSMERKYFLFCIPDSGNYGQYLDVFLKYLKNNPEIRNRLTSPLFIQAMAEAFSCK